MGTSTSDVSKKEREKEKRKGVRSEEIKGVRSEWHCRAGLSADAEPGPGGGILESRPVEVDLVGLAALGYEMFGLRGPAHRVPCS